MPNKILIIAIRTVAAGVAAVSLLACSQQTQNRQPQGAIAPGASQGGRATDMNMSGDMQQMMARCNQMMREGHGDMQMSPEMQKVMDDCNRMMQMHGNQPGQ